MNPVVFHVTLEAAHQLMPQQLSACMVQEDMRAYRLHIKVRDGAEEWDYASATDARIVFVRADGMRVVGVGQISGEGIIYDVGTTELEYPGRVVGVLQLWKEGDRRLTTSSFCFDVMADPLNKKAVESMSRLPELDALLSHMESIADDLRGWVEELDPELAVPPADIEIAYTGGIVPGADNLREAVDAAYLRAAEHTGASGGGEAGGIALPNGVTSVNGASGAVTLTDEDIAYTGDAIAADNVQEALGALSGAADEAALAADAAAVLAAGASSAAADAIAAAALAGSSADAAMAQANAAFTSASNGKAAVAGAMGTPAQETFAQIAGRIGLARDTLAGNLAGKGVPVVAGEPLQALADKVSQIESGGWNVFEQVTQPDADEGLWIKESGEGGIAFTGPRGAAQWERITTFANLAPARENAVCAVDGDTLYIATGVPNASTQGTAAVTAKDLLTGAEAAFGNMQTARTHAAGGLWGRVLVVSGGSAARGTAGIMASVEGIDLDTGESVAFASLTTPRCDHAAVIVGDELIVGGGMSGPSTVLGTVECVNLRTGARRSLPSITPRQSLSASVLGNHVVFIGGSTDTAHTGGTGLVEAIDLVNNVIVNYPSIDNRSRHGSVTVGDKIIVGTGVGTANTSVTVSTVYALDANSAQTLPVMMSGARSRYGAAAYPAKGMALFVGGSLERTYAAYITGFQDISLFETPQDAALIELSPSAPGTAGRVSLSKDGALCGAVQAVHRLVGTELRPVAAAVKAHGGAWGDV